MNDQTNTPNNSTGGQTFLESIEPNVAGALAYLFPPLMGIVFLVAEKNNKFIRFHAFQAALLGIAAAILYSVLFAIIIGWVIIPVVQIIYIGLMLLMMWKAYKNEEYELPFIGKIAREQTNK